MNNELDPQNESHELAHMTSDEIYSSKLNEDHHLEAQYEEQTHIEDDFQDHGWPGDGSGTDDLADFNANEAMDYTNE